ncbi:hypothetical protein FA09DRAFT_171686 [Tilletiopsis washingtonensis]|uniref:PARP catalytic domain-containing protein n=1 Tax=Tilletiopsis washingtonensis TaxID=58919 RepID=A0A316Z045_9BASI|nr:hypothetical protein FA09DRAFT_171686 [Tilletiopsis washingtonensis]PWN94656.1 hypothetical protein FA09DRAFT_171686 [Tilletiopsis washingtonensis]
MGLAPRRRAALRRGRLMSSGRHLRPSFVSLITSRPLALPRRFHLRPTASRSRLASSAMPPTTRSSRSRSAAEQPAAQPAPKRSKRGSAAAPAKAVEKQKVQTYISVSESPEPEGEGSSTAGPSTRAETSVEQSPPAAAATAHEHEQSQGSVGGMKGSPLSKGDAEGSQPRSQHSAAPSKSSQPSAGASKASQPGTGDAGQPHSQRSASQAKQAKQSQQSVADEDNDNSFDFGSDCSSVKSADFDIEDPMQSFGLSSREREAIEIGIQATAARLADEGTASGGGGTLLLKEGAVLEVQLPLHPLSPLQRTTLDIAEDAYLVLISLDVQGGWTSSAVPPTSIVRLVSTTSSTIISHSDEHTSATPLGLLLYAGVRAIAKKMWGEPEYLYELSTSTLRLLCNAGDYCFCCAERLKFGGVKPTVCDSPLCQYQLDDLGLGASLSELRDERIADFLIATAHAAAVGAVSRPSTLPALPSSRDGSPLTAKSLRTTIEALPPVEVMAALSPTELKAQIGAEAFATLRWIFTSNRAHLVALAQHERIQINGDDIGGELHLKVSTSTRSHEAAFQAQKAKYGSFMAWHGSGTQNWHAIIRTSLKNASGTAMMSTGAAYGAGIYVSIARTACKTPLKLDRRWPMAPRSRSATREPSPSRGRTQHWAARCRSSPLWRLPTRPSSSVRREPA